MRVLQQNLNHCEAAQDLLMQTARELKPDVLIISEPYRRLGTQLWVSDVTEKAAIWSCGGSPLRDVVVGAGGGFVRARLGNIYFYSCYAPPGLTPGEFADFLDRLVGDARERFPVAIAGDFNAWAVDWGSRKTNPRGRALLEAMACLDVVLLNRGAEPTYIRREKKSIVDLTFVSGSLGRGNGSWKVTDVYNCSDHQLISWEVSTDQGSTRLAPAKTNALGWKTSMFDPELFRAALDDGPIGEGGATKKAEEVMRRVAEACDATMPRKRSTNRLPPMYWWNDTVASARRECIRTRRLLQRGRKRASSDELETKHKEARRKLVKVIKESKRKCWDELLEEVDGDPWGRPYKIVTTRLRSQPMPPPTCPVLLERIVATLFPQQPECEHQVVGDEGEAVPPVTVEELRRAGAKVGCTKAPGLDGIPNVALKAAIGAAPGMFLDMYNTCLQEGGFPAKWKQQRLVLLPKGKKPPEEPSSYRPLCMLDSAGKVLERIIHGRIVEVAEQHLAENQFGYRKGRSTLDAIDRMVGIAGKAISGERWKGGKKKYCLVATLDIRNAFNSAKWDRIMEALEGMGVPKYLRKMIVSYFTDRVLMYDTERGPERHRVTGGVPQGSVLGPLLWNIMYDGLLKLRLPRAVTTIAFADDVALVIVGKYLDDIENLFDVAFKRIRRWMETAGLKLAEHKTEAVLITSRKKAETVNLRAGNQRITSQPFIRYLGVMIDARLNFKQQAEHASKKASAVGAVLSRLMPNIGGPKQKRRTLLSSVVTSVLTYGIAIWADALASQESRRKVAPVYRLSALRVASAFRTVSEDAVCVIAGVLPIRVLAEERRALFRRRGSTPLSAKELKMEERESSLRRWQRLWDASVKARWTHRLIPEVGKWQGRSHGDVNYYLTQMLTGHGCFRAYLHRFGHEDSPECPNCRGVEEDAEHVFFACPRFEAQRSNLKATVEREITPETLVETMLTTGEAWEATSAFATEVLKELRQEEQERRKRDKRERRARGNP